MTLLSRSGLAAVGVLLAPLAGAADDAEGTSGHGGHGGHDYAPPALSELGGAIDMVDQSGLPFTEENFLGHYSLVYAGYMECLEACPLGVGTVQAAAAALSASGLETEAVFIDIRAPRLDDMTGGMHGHDKDHASMMKPGAAGMPKTGPEIRREALGEWAEEKGGSLRVLSGTRKQVRGTVQAFMVRAEANMARNAEAGPRLNHTTHVYLIGPDGAVKDLFYHDTPLDEMVAGVEAAAAKG
ncbi:SCO family protein [Henriciella sp.]|uniref:SCO family protein n=1 Tax=Henriciella sp. TaxID=1968823 RepID=UPI003C7079F0